MCNDDASLRVTCKHADTMMTHIYTQTLSGPKQVMPACMQAPLAAVHTIAPCVGCG